MAANGYTACVGRQIKAHRSAAELTQTQLAELAQVSQPTISRIEQGEGSVDAPTLLLIAEALDVSVQALLGAASMEEEIEVAARPGESDSGMAQMRAVALDYLASFRRVAELS